MKSGICLTFHELDGFAWKRGFSISCWEFLIFNCAHRKGVQGVYTWEIHCKSLWLVMALSCSMFKQITLYQLNNNKQDGSQNKANS